MKVVSTRGQSKTSLSECILDGLAPDGGLYMPTEWPEILKDCKAENFSDYASRAIAPFFEGDLLEAELEGFIDRALNFPITLNYFEKHQALLELFHGPTSAFKDFGARFLAEVLSKIGQEQGPLTILVATSGDTGGAVASAFYDKPGINVAILFPEGKVSKLQEQQLTCWGKNVKSFRVKGTFDDCQALVKEAFNDPEIKKQYRLTSANSINLGRLLPQMAYQGFSAQMFKLKTGIEPHLVIPTGNLGNAFGAFWAKKMGAPIQKILMASNANKSIPDYFESGVYNPHSSIQTLANAMDVGAPSNMERLLMLNPSIEELKLISSSISISDEEIKGEIENFYNKYQTPICPHTAVGTLAGQKVFKKEAYIVSATAHATKFREVVEPLIGREIPLPPKLSELMDKKSFCIDLEANLKILLNYL